MILGSPGSPQEGSRARDRVGSEPGSNATVNHERPRTEYKPADFGPGRNKR